MFTRSHEEQIRSAAEDYGVDPRAMIALGLTESSGQVVWNIGNQEMPPIRPEVHKFYAALKEKPALRDKAVQQGLAHPKRNGVRLPRSYKARYEFYHRMVAIDPEAAAWATSFGWGQVMGFNYEMLGCESAQEVAYMAETVAGQTELVALYLQATGLTPFMNELPSRSAAERIARGYNGPAWRENNYAHKLISNWKRAENNGTPALGRDVSDLQTSLGRLGYDPGGVDGKLGTATRAAVRRYQEDNGLVADGIAGSMTWKQLNQEIAELNKIKSQKSKDRVGSVGIGVGTIAVATELLNEFEGFKPQIIDLMSDLKVPDGAVEIALMLALAYLAYTKFFNK